MNATVFGVFAVVALSRLFVTANVRATLAAGVTALVAIAVLGYWLAATGRLSRIWGIAAFLIGWFWTPYVPLAGLAIVALARVNAGVASTPPPGASSKVKPDLGSAPSDDALYTLELAAGEFKDRLKALATEFGSIYGQYAIPMLVDIGGVEHAVYVETAKWDWPAKARFYKWAAALRTSDREDLPILIRSKADVPDDVTGYALPVARNAFELAGLMNVQLFETPGWAETNANTLRRLAQEYFNVALGDGVTGLEAMDALVINHLRAPERALPSTILLIGSFFGEALIKDIGGSWMVRGRTTADVTVEIESGGKTVEANVFVKTTKLLRNGSVDSTAPMLRSIADPR